MNYKDKVVEYEGNAWVVTVHDEEKLTIVPYEATVNRGLKKDLPPDREFANSIDRRWFHILMKYK